MHRAVESFGEGIDLPGFSLDRRIQEHRFSRIIDVGHPGVEFAAGRSVFADDKRRVAVAVLSHVGVKPNGFVLTIPTIGFGRFFGALPIIRF